MYLFILPIYLIGLLFFPLYIKVFKGELALFLLLLAAED